VRVLHDQAAPLLARAADLAAGDDRPAGRADVVGEGARDPGEVDDPGLR
jgi:hypothetical protein